jgi:solute carrier family 25 (mitochondrial carnitine/acylcarnitine transporter), member 20/29
MSAEQKSQAPPGLLKQFIAGGVGGGCLVLVGQPLDTIKVRLQTQATPKAGEAFKYAGALDCAKQTIKAEGPFALYKVSRTAHCF